MVEKNIIELYDKNLICPVCGNKYTTKKVKSSKLRAVKRDSDLMTYYRGENPIIYAVVVCNKCGFAYLDSELEDIKDKYKEIILDGITKKISNKNYTNERTIEQSEKTYKLALYCGELINSKKIYLASLVLRLAWLYRFKEDIYNENRFLKNAMESFKYAYERESLKKSSFDKKTVEYLIGEINRRIGNKKDAIKWFNIVISDNPGTSMRIENLAREQWQKTKE
ncbi:DUF2225 domain-containing protein [Clostridium sp. D2Q-14]|uniref:DUF2225 domain-containing protein n=1 Tax=Anaeromonas gelatinilytica TaxID=2683194 RepID=UPI00193BB0A6|nr:DUF2225 domain-containing protein [Anaeromonas gelatinilytica]MBS4536592.1 DUF2225 domain-containing protein [Anaeromonas gelatinilytica]